LAIFRLVKSGVERIHALDNNCLYDLEQKAVDYGIFTGRLYDTCMLNVSFYRA
jgi:hypothetical protein